MTDASEPTLEDFAIPVEDIAAWHRRMALASRCPPQVAYHEREARRFEEKQ